MVYYIYYTVVDTFSYNTNRNHVYKQREDQICKVFCHFIPVFPLWINPQPPLFTDTCLCMAVECAKRLHLSCHSQIGYIWLHCLSVRSGLFVSLIRFFFFFLQRNLSLMDAECVWIVPRERENIFVCTSSRLQLWYIHCGFALMLFRGYHRCFLGQGWKSNLVIKDLCSRV